MVKLIDAEIYKHFLDENFLFCQIHITTISLDLNEKLKSIITSVDICKNTKVITNKNKCTYDTQKNKNTKNKIIKPFSRTDQVRDSLFILFY